MSTSGFLPAKPKLTPPSSSLGQDSYSAHVMKAFLELLRDFSETARATAKLYANFKGIRLSGTPTPFSYNNAILYNSLFSRPCYNFLP